MTPTQQRTAFFTLVALAVIGVGIFALMSMKQRGGADVTVACTLEALVCPDGSGVGRTGSSCTFAPCPSRADWTGEFVSDPQGARLVILAPAGGGGDMTYALPLDISGIANVETFKGKIVRVTGMFTEGNHLRVNTMDIAGGGVGTGEGDVPVGGSSLFYGVKVSVNSIVSDSRCPSGVQCVWAGAVSANVTLESDTDKETLTMTSGTDAHAFDTYRITLLGATPQKSANTPIDPKAYQLHFKVEHLR